MVCVLVQMAVVGSKYTSVWKTVSSLSVYVRIINAVEIYGVGKQLPYGVCICTVKRQCNFRKTVFAVARSCVDLYCVYHNQW